MSDPQDSLDKYLPVLQRFGTPQDMDRIRKRLVDAETFLARHAEITEMLEGRKRWRWIKDLTKEAAAWIVGVGLAISMIYGGYTLLHRVSPPTEESSR